MIRYLSEVSKSNLLCNSDNTGNIREISIFIHYKEHCMEEGNLASLLQTEITGPHM